MRFLNNYNKKRTPAQNIALSGVLVALALIFGYIEYLIPFALPFPGAKLGLANLVTLTGLYFLSPVQVLTVLVARIILSGFLFGNFSTILYSITGGMISFVGMVIVRKLNLLSPVGVSILGGVTHNIGQLIVACLIISSTAPVIYLPYLILLGATAGAIIGIPAKIVLQRLQAFN